MPKIEETMSLEYNVGAGEHPYQHDEMRMHILEQGLVDFIYGVSSKHTVSVAEEKALRLAVAIKLLMPFQGQADSEVLKDRIMRRREELDGQQRTSTLPASTESD